MVADVVLAGPDGLDDAAPRPADGADQAREPVRQPSGRRGRRIAAGTLLAVGCLVTVLSLLVLVGSWLDDAQIDAHEGRAVADVLSVSVGRTAVRFVTPDGTVVIPSTGVLYPGGLAAGERVRVEYDTNNTELVRVAGRDFRLALLPVGTSIAICWAIVGPLVWWLRRRPNGPRPSTT
ncbi:MAG TPA: DUF3592 domain-containing protein [Pseudonocardiaceae bacterium]|nr:DUF3592 domain-containing protein [Pseudonocardiaceae bacterium]